MGRWYCFFRRVARHWFRWVVGLILLTLVLGVDGFARANPDNNFATNAYLTALLFALNCADVAQVVGWELNLARWLGFAVWFVTVVSVLVKLFGQRVLTWYVRWWAAARPGHVVVGGLGPADADTDRLVEQLRAAGRDVVVLEPDADHPGLDACRAAGAVCLTGSPLEAIWLRKARLDRAGTLLALGEDDRANVSLLCLAADLLAEGGDFAPPPADPLAPTAGTAVGCVVQVTEPRLLDILRRHDARPAAGRLHARAFNVHELVARAMLRECLIGLSSPVLDTVLVLGTGAGGRLAQALAVRAAKDRWIDRDPTAPDADSRPLKVDVYDPDAEEWASCLTSGLDPAVAALLTVGPHPCDAHRCGFRGADVREKIVRGGYHAAFVGMSDEAHALIQAVALREALPDTVPVVVRVREEATGFGGLLARTPSDNFGANVHAVGTQDQVFALAASLNPMVEVFARALHQDYLLLTHQRFDHATRRGDLAEAAKIRAKAAFVRWRKLSADLKQSNRLLAGRLSRYLTIPGTGRRFRAEFRPNALLNPQRYYRLSADEVEVLARLEHDGWMADMTALGWRRGHGAGPHDSDPVRKLNPNLVPWADLDEGMKEYDRNVIRRLPFAFAKADYEVIEES